MPIFRMDTGLGYFTDVPGCGGAAVVRHLEVRFGPLAFHDPAHTDAPRSQRWSRTSPQHIGRKSLQRLFPADFFVASFTLVRHPADRLRAVYAFQRDVEGAIPRTTGFGDWIEDVAERMHEEPWVFDNAVRPMADMIPDEAEVFRLEEGTEAIDAWLDKVSGVPGPALGPVPPTGIEVEVTPFDRDRIAEIYDADFRRFRYGADGPTATAPPPRVGFLRTLRRGRGG
jgi:hypothetical protein